jgi:two-component system chemotaxis sensor kinase CheA
LEGPDAIASIEDIGGAPVYRLRGNLLPLVDLNRELRLPASSTEGGSAQIVNIVVLQADDRQFGLIVDEINDTEEIVVKPLGKQLKGLACFAGATIMGDGQVALILDVLGIAQMANVVAELRSRAVNERTAKNAESAGCYLLSVKTAGWQPGFHRCPGWRKFRSIRSSDRAIRKWFNIASILCA